MSVLQKLLHRETTPAQHAIARDEPDNSAHAPPVADTTAAEDLQGYIEMPSSATQLTDGAPVWAPECGTPCYSKAHRHDHQ